MTAPGRSGATTRRSATDGGAAAGAAEPGDDRQLDRLEQAHGEGNAAGAEGEVGDRGSVVAVVVVDGRADAADEPARQEDGLGEGQVVVHDEHRRGRRRASGATGDGSPARRGEHRERDDGEHDAEDPRPGREGDRGAAWRGDGEQPRDRSTGPSSSRGGVARREPPLGAVRRPVDERVGRRRQHDGGDDGDARRRWRRRRRRPSGRRWRRRSRPTSGTGAAMRTTVSDSARGTSVATSTASHPAHAPVAATTCTGREAPSRASPSAGPARTGRSAHVTRTGQGPPSARSTAVRLAAERRALANRIAWCRTCVGLVHRSPNTSGGGERS